MSGAVKDAVAKVGTKVSAAANKNPVYTGAVTILATIGVIWVGRKMMKSKSGMQGPIMRNSNHALGGNNPMWPAGNMDAGQGGYLDRDATIPNLASIDPTFNHSIMTVKLKRQAAARRMAAMRREGLDPGCPAGQVLDPVSQTCMAANDDEAEDYSADADWRTTDESCSTGWDPEAEQEAAALVATGGMDHPPTEDSALKSGRYSAARAGASAAVSRHISQSRQFAGKGAGM